jgi:hypothetical protein
MHRMISITIAGLLLLTSVVAPASARSVGFHGAGMAASFHGPLPARSVARPPVAQPQTRKSCYRTRLRQLLQLGHDYDLAQEEALLICG